MLLPVDLGEGAALVLRGMDTAGAVLALVTGDIERIRRYEAWAHDKQSPAAMERFTRYLLAGYEAGSTIPTLITQDGAAVGAVTGRIDPARRTAELGYWIVAGYSGRGLVTRACAAMLPELARRGVRRVVIRTAAENERSIAVARRLGFTLDTVRPRAFPVAGIAHDELVLSRDLEPEPGPGSAPQPGVGGRT
ncbi:MAG: GNAT family protein [Naasia sp.]